MGIFGFFKKNKQIEKNEVVSQGQLFEWLLNKKKQHQEKEQKFLAPIKERIFQLVSELKSEISVLEKVDIDSKKVEVRIKLIVKENLKNYIEYLQKMIERLSEINQKNKIVEKINFIFDNFNNRSKVSYEKITFIVGREMQATRDSIKKFLKDLERILKSNKKDFEEFETIELIEKDVKNFKNIGENKSKILKILNEDIEKLKKLEKVLKNKEEEIKELRKSNKFKQEEKKIKELELKKQELDKNIDALKNSIDFKALSNFYHKFENDMKLIKEYKENFKQTLQRLGIKNLSKFLEEAKQYDEEILKLIQKIEEKEKEIFEVIIDDFGINDLKRKVEEIGSEIKIVESEKFAKEKKLKNVEKELNDVLNEIKDKLKKLDVEFE